jgi:chromosome segregation ATPase
MTTAAITQNALNPHDDKIAHSVDPKHMEEERKKLIQKLYLDRVNTNREKRKLDEENAKNIDEKWEALIKKQKEMHTERNELMNRENKVPGWTREDTQEFASLSKELDSNSKRMETLHANTIEINTKIKEGLSESEKFHWQLKALNETVELSKAHHEDEKDKIKIQLNAANQLLDATKKKLSLDAKIDKITTLKNLVDNGTRVSDTVKQKYKTEIVNIENEIKTIEKTIEPIEKEIGKHESEFERYDQSLKELEKTKREKRNEKELIKNTKKDLENKKATIKQDLEKKKELLNHTKNSKEREAIEEEIKKHEIDLMDIEDGLETLQKESNAITSAINNKK